MLPRGDPVNHQGTDHHRHNCITGRVKRQRRNEGRLRGVVIGTFGCSQSLNLPGPESFEMLADAFLIPDRGVAFQRDGCRGDQATKNAELIVTDCWPADLGEADRERFAAFCIDDALLDECAPEAFFVPCPPVTRGQEVTDGAMRHPRCLVPGEMANGPSSHRPKRIYQDQTAAEGLISFGAEQVAIRLGVNRIQRRLC